MEKICNRTKQTKFLLWHVRLEVSLPMSHQEKTEQIENQQLFFEEMSTETSKTEMQREKGMK